MDLAIGVRASWRHKATSRSPARPSSTTQGRPTRPSLEPCSTRSRTCRKRRWCSCSAAVTARPISCRSSPGSSSPQARPAGRACRPSATSSTTTFNSVTNSRVRPRLPSRLFKSATACAGTSPTWRSRSAAASISRRAIARVISATSASRRSNRPWTSPAGSKRIWAARGTCSIRATTFRHVLIARGRDAADVAITTTFGPNTLLGFRVWTDEV
jgi:hypothetical protein